MHKITSAKLDAQKLNRLTQIVSETSKSKPNIIETVSKIEIPRIDNNLPVDANCVIQSSQLADKTTIAKKYLAEQAAKISCQKLAEEKAANLLK